MTEHATWCLVFGIGLSAWAVSDPPIHTFKSGWQMMPTRLMAVGLTAYAFFKMVW
jgi:hypothetical protein